MTLLFKAPLESQSTLFGFILKWEVLCPEQSYVSWDMIMWVMLVENGPRMTKIPHFWTWHCHAKTADITVCSSERNCRTLLVGCSLPSLALQPIMWYCRRTKMSEATLYFRARFWRDEFSNYGSACFHSMLRHEALQRGTLGVVVQENMSFLWLQSM